MYSSSYHVSTIRQRINVVYSLGCILENPPTPVLFLYVCCIPTLIVDYFLLCLQIPQTWRSTSIQNLWPPHSVHHESSVPGVSSAKCHPFILDPSTYHGSELLISNGPIVYMQSLSPHPHRSPATLELHLTLNSRSMSPCCSIFWICSCVKSRSSSTASLSRSCRVTLPVPAHTDLLIDMRNDTFFIHAVKYLL